MSGVPGTVGGGIYGNAGAHDQWFSEVVETVEILNANGEVMELQKARLLCLAVLRLKKL